MTSIGAFDAKTHFSALLERAAAGEEITITKHGKPVAKLVSAERPVRLSVEETIRQLREGRKGVTLGELDWKELRDTGRR